MQTRCMDADHILNGSQLYKFIDEQRSDQHLHEDVIRVKEQYNYHLLPKINLHDLSGQYYVTRICLIMNGFRFALEHATARPTDIRRERN